jgi:hypothetical protein
VFRKASGFCAQIKQKLRWLFPAKNSPIDTLWWGSRRLWALVLRAKRRVFRDKQQLTEMREQNNAIAMAGNTL